MKSPSHLATEIVLALDPTLANRNPDAYKTTVDGQPSGWPKEVHDEVIARATAVETVLSDNKVQQTWIVDCNIRSDIDPEYTHRMSLRFTCAENDLPAVVLDHMEHNEIYWDTRIHPILEILGFCLAE